MSILQEFHALRTATLCLVFLVPSLPAGAVPLPDGAAEAPGFVANHGQLDGPARYYAESPLGAVYFEPHAVAVVTKPQGTRNTGVVVRVAFPAAGNRLALEATEPRPGRMHAFRGNDPDRWVADVPTFGAVRYRGVAPDADLIYRVQDGRLKYDVALAAGADLSNVRLRYHGVDRLEIEPTGALVLHTAAGLLREECPSMYQVRAGVRLPVTGGYRLVSKTEIGFWASGHDSSLPLVVDPGLVWSSFLGGTSLDQAWHLKADAAGDLYIVGSSTSTDYPTNTGAFQRTKAESKDIVVTKMRGDGTGLVWSTFLGGNGSNDEARCADVDQDGNVYVTGSTNSSNFPTTAGALRTTNPNGTTKVFVTKLTASGNGLVYSTYLGGSSNDYGYAIAVDVAGNATVAGGTSSADFPTTSGVVKPTFTPSFYDLSDAFVAKLNASGTAVVYSTYLGALGSDGVAGLALDSSGAPTVVGATSSLAYPVTSKAYDRTYDAGQEGFVTRLNGTGTQIVYSTFLGANGDDNVLGVALDTSGAVHVTGLTKSTNFPTTVNALQPTYGGSTSDAFVAMLSPAGDALSYSSYLGGSGSDAGYAIVVLPGGFAGVTGSTNSTDFPVTGGTYDATNNGGVDTFLSAVSTHGAGLAYSTYIGGSGFEAGRGIAVNSNNHVTVAGYTDSGNFPTTAGAYDPSKNGTASYDCFVSTFDIGMGPVDVGPQIPSALSLSSPHPNPFSESTTFRLNVARQTWAVVRVLDARGRLVRTLAQRDLAAGDHGWTWDGRDAHGRVVGAGMYLLDVQTPEGRTSRRAIRLE